MSELRELSEPQFPENPECVVVTVSISVTVKMHHESLICFLGSVACGLVASESQDFVTAVRVTWEGIEHAMGSFGPTHEHRLACQKPMFLSKKNNIPMEVLYNLNQMPSNAGYKFLSHTT